VIAKLNPIARAVWRSAPYQRHGRCATCGCTHDEDGRPLQLAGVNSDSMVCVECFVDEHGELLPNYRRTPRRQVAA
jgi:hypothetical protein